jgi:hypothetical protein
MFDNEFLLTLNFSGGIEHNECSMYTTPRISTLVSTTLYAPHILIKTPQDFIGDSSCCEVPDSLAPIVGLLRWETCRRGCRSFDSIHVSYLTFAFRLGTPEP